MDIRGIIQGCTIWRVFPLVTLAILLVWGGFIGLWGQVASLPPGVRVLEQSAQGMLLEFVPDFQQETIDVNDRTYQHIRFTGATYPALQGQAMIPERSALVGVPPGMTVAVSVEEARPGSAYSGRLLPVPSANRENDVVAAVYTESAGTFDQPMASFTPVRLSGTGWLRQQQVATIIFSPVSYRDNRIQTYDRIVARVTFTPDAAARPVTGPARPDPHFTGVYDAVVVNAEAARSWQAFPRARRALAKATPSLDRGAWYTLLIETAGMYRLTRDDLAQADIAVDQLDPRTIRMFNNGGRPLPETLDALRPASLTEIPIFVTGEADGRLDDGDAILFYGHPTSGWDPLADGSFMHYTHPYQDANVYWLTFGDVAGARMASRASGTATGALQPTTFRSRLFREVEKEKLHPSGLEWLWEIFFDGEQKTFTADLPGYVAGTPVHYRIGVKGGSTGQHRFTVSEGATQIFDTRFTTFNRPSLSGSHVVALSNDRSELQFEYSTGSQAGRGYLDWIEWEYDRDLRAESGRLFFEAPQVTGPVAFTIQDLSGDGTQVFDVTDPAAPVVITGLQAIGGATRFVDMISAMPVRQYQAVTSSGVLTATLERNANSDLRTRPRDAAMVIITHDDFYDDMLRLQAHREAYDGIITEVVRISAIYDEFSGGLMDATAIRDFLKFAYENWNPSGVPLSYVLLAGDGDYDFKNVLSDEDANWIPPFEIDSDNDLFTRCTDDWYTYIVGTDRFMDLAIGRIPVRSATEARQYVDKVIRYQTRPEFGVWKSTMTFAADDELTPGDNTQRIHTDQSETVARASYMPSFLDQRKVYLMDFPEVRLTNVSGVRKPGAEAAFVANMNRGSAIVSYFGHGNHRILAHEQLLSKDEDLNKIQNASRLFFFYPATCAFGRYDLPETEGMSEDLLVASNRGTIAALNSTRDVFARQNFSLAILFYQQLFSETPTARLGPSVMAAKALVSGNVINNEKFHLFGDPTLRLALPTFSAGAISLDTDSLVALSQTRVQGTVTRAGVPWSDFRGTVQLSVFDDRRTGVRVMGNGDRVTFGLPGRTIFRGSSVLTPEDGGRFNISFVVPKDITYGGRNGRVGVYFSGAGTDGAGYLEKISLGGTADVSDDQDGPQIFLSLEGLDPGDETFMGTTPTLLAEFNDANGINITGEIGHKIQLTLDGADNDRVDLSDRFTYAADSFTDGLLRFRFDPLDEGPHRAVVKAWDNFNNSTTETLDFTIVEDSELAIRELYNFPNPFSRRTQFTFFINQPADVVIKVYTVAGRLVQEFSDIRVDPAGLYISPVWNGRDRDQDLMANGVYLYKVVARSLLPGQSGSAEKIGKFVIAR